MLFRSQIVKKANRAISEAQPRTLVINGSENVIALVINTDLHSDQTAIAHMRAARNEAILLYQQHGEEVRATYLPSKDMEVPHSDFAKVIRQTDRVDIKACLSEFLSFLNKSPTAA